METNRTREVSLKVVCSMIAIDPDGPVTAACLNCGSPLEIHQPNSELPDRMLATCDECDAWHVIECVSDDDRAVVLLIPSTDAVSGLFRG